MLKSRRYPDRSFRVVSTLLPSSISKIKHQNVFNNFKSDVQKNVQTNRERNKHHIKSGQNLESLLSLKFRNISILRHQISTPRLIRVKINVPYFGHNLSLPRHRERRSKTSNIENLYSSLTELLRTKNKKLIPGNIQESEAYSFPRPRSPSR